MANSEHIAVVRLGPIAIRHWAAIYPGGYLDLEGADLSGIDLSGADLTMLFLRRADLQDARLSGACLDGVNLRGARLDRARLDGASLRQADLGPRVDLTGGDKILVATTLDGTDLSGAILEEAILDQVDFRTAAVQGSLMGGASMSDQQRFMLQIGGAIVDAVRPEGELVQFALP